MSGRRHCNTERLCAWLLASTFVPIECPVLITGCALGSLHRHDERTSAHVYVVWSTLTTFLAYATVHANRTASVRCCAQRRKHKPFGKSSTILLLHRTETSPGRKDLSRLALPISPTAQVMLPCGNKQLLHAVLTATNDVAATQMPRLLTVDRLQPHGLGEGDEIATRRVSPNPARHSYPSRSFWSPVHKATLGMCRKSSTRLLEDQGHDSLDTYAARQAAIVGKLAAESRTKMQCGVLPFWHIAASSGRGISDRSAGSKGWTTGSQAASATLSFFM